jgi:hypothetical protein
LRREKNEVEQLPRFGLKERHLRQNDSPGAHLSQPRNAKDSSGVLVVSEQRDIMPEEAELVPQDPAERTYADNQNAFGTVCSVERLN